LAGGSPAASHFLCLAKESNQRKATPPSTKPRKSSLPGGRQRTRPAFVCISKVSGAQTPLPLIHPAGSIFGVAERGENQNQGEDDDTFVVTIWASHIWCITPAANAPYASCSHMAIVKGKLMEQYQAENSPINWPVVLAVYLIMLAAYFVFGFTEMALGVLAFQTFLVVINWLGFRHLNRIKEALLLYVFVPLGAIWFLYAFLHLSPRF